MRILWLCPLIEYPRPHFWCPALRRVQDGPTGFFPAVWTTTPGAMAQPWACGVAEVSDEQLVALTQEPGLHLFAATDATQQFRLLPRVRRIALAGFLQQIGLAPPAQTEVLGMLLDRVIASNEPRKTVASLLEELATEIGRQA